MYESCWISFPFPPRFIDQYEEDIFKYMNATATAKAYLLCLYNFMSLPSISYMFPLNYGFKVKNSDLN